MKTKRIKHKFTAPDIEILTTSNTPDSQGITIPPGAVIQFKEAQKIFYGSSDQEHIAGFARLRRTPTGIKADMTIYSTMQDSNKSFELIKRLYPATAFVVHGAVEDLLSHIEIIEVFLTESENHDKSIRQLGDRLSRYIERKDMH